MALLPAVAGAACDGGWSARARMGVPRQETGIAAIGEVVYVVGGFDGDGRATAAAEAYDTRADRWTPLAPLPLAVHHPGAAAIAGKLYVLGGLTGGNFAAVDTLFEYDPGADAWRERARLPAARGAMGVAVIGERVYAAGGLRGGSSVGDLAAYDPTADAWTVLPTMPTTRDHLAAAAIDGRLYAVGGRDSGRLFGALEVFDPGAVAWRTDLARMPTARGGLMAAALGGRLFAFGGEGNPDDPLGIFAANEAYDVVTDRWTRLDPMRTPRHGTVAVTVGDAIYVAGGAIRQGFGVSGVTERFVPPGAESLVVTRTRLAHRRIRFRARIASGAPDPAGVPLQLHIADQADVERASLLLPAHALEARGRRLIHRAPEGITRLVLVPGTGGQLRVRALAVLPAGSGQPRGGSVTLALGDAVYCGALSGR